GGSFRVRRGGDNLGTRITRESVDILPARGRAQQPAIGFLLLQRFAFLAELQKSGNQTLMSVEVARFGSDRSAEMADRLFEFSLRGQNAPEVKMRLRVVGID